MSVGVTEKRVLYDNPCAPIVKFSSNSTYVDNQDDEDDMTNDSTLTTSNHDSSLNPMLGLFIVRFIEQHLLFIDSSRF
jgi:hypothetical protein